MRIIKKPIVAAGVFGFIVGVLWLAGVHFVNIRDDSVHYHANFALYVHGERDPFESFTFYEEVQSCGDELINPRGRVHMHDNVSHVVHVHDHAVTWGHFFANLGYGLSNQALTTDDGVFIDDEEDFSLRFILNGEEISDVANRTIGDLDTLLVNYGDDGTDMLAQRFESIQTDAAKYNELDDPSSCAGTQELTAMERLRRAFGLR